MEEKFTIDHFDKEELYCRKLGHHLTFDYCRSEHNGLPCPKIRDCWFEKIPIDDYLEQNFKPEEIAYIFEPPKPKITSIFEIIQKAQAAKKNS